MGKYLGSSGLAYLWGKMKAYVASVVQVDDEVSTTSDNLVKNKAIPAYINSRGENLVSNGFASLGNNYNFPDTVLDTAETFVGKGSFSVTSNKSAVRYLTEMIPVDTRMTYLLHYYVKNTELTNTYDGIKSYDVDGLNIDGSQTGYWPNTLTVLTSDLSDGDTVIHLGDVSHWADNSTSYNRGCIFWNYRNSGGYLYPPETYSRNVWSNLWDYNAGAIDYENNTITLNSPWTHGNIPQGTQLSQVKTVGSFVYGNSAYQPTAGEWVEKSFMFTPAKFRAGTAYIQLLFLINYSNVTGNVFRVCGVSFTSLATLNDLNGYLKTTDISSWAKASTKPTYTASEVGALPDTTSYAHSSSVDGDAYRAISIPFGQVDSTSTSTAFTATVQGITELRDGVCVYLRNGVVTSAANCTLNINGLGAKRIYYTQGAASAVTSHFNVNYTELFVYNSSRVEGGCWDFFMGYYSDSNSIGYDIREASNGGKKTKTAMQRYQILLSCFDGMLLPVYSGSYTIATTKVLTTEKFNPFGQIYYYGSTTNMDAGANFAANVLYSQATSSTVDFRYSFNLGTTLVAGNVVYLVCVPQTDGSAVLHSSPISFALPATEDGLLYKRIGKCIDTYRIVLEQEKPVYYYKDGAIRLWTNSGIEALEARVEILEEATPIQPSQYYPN